MLVDFAIAALITVVGFSFEFIEFVVVLPGLIPAFVLQLIARSIWNWSGGNGLLDAFDRDEVPGPAALVLGSLFAWWALVYCARRIVRAARRRDSR